MASEELPEPLEEKKENPISTENIKEQMEIKSNVGNIVNEDGDLIKAAAEVLSKLGISAEPKQIITEKPENLEKRTVNLEGEKEQVVVKHEESPPPIEEPTTQEQEKVNGETENGLHSTQFTEELSPEKANGDEVPANASPFLSEEVQKKLDSEEVAKEDAHRNLISEKDETEKDAIQSNSVALSDEDCQKNVETSTGNASQNPEEDVIKEVQIPSSTTPLVAEEDLVGEKGRDDMLEEVKKEQTLQIETAKENLAEEKLDETEEQSREGSMVASSEETTLEEVSQENQTPEMICEETEQTKETTAIVHETSQIDYKETIPHEDSTLYYRPITNEETRKSDEGSEHMPEEVKEVDIPASATPLILEEAKESADIKEEIKEEAQKNQISEEDETDKDFSQSTSMVDLSERDYQNETENANGNPEEEVTKEVDIKEVENPSSVTPPVLEEVLEEAKEKVDVEEVQTEQADEENWAEEKECVAEAEVQNRDVPQVVVSEEIVPEEASKEKETPEMISEEVKPTEDTIGVGEKDETVQNDNEENAAHNDITSSHQEITNEETRKFDEDSEHISDESTLATVTTRDVMPEIEIKDSETKAPTSEKDNRDIEKIKDEDDAKSPEEVELSESIDAPMKTEEATPNDSEEKKPEGDDELKHKETEQEFKSIFATEEQLEKSTPSPSEEEVYAEKDTIETKPIEETEEIEQNAAQNEITLDSKEILSNDEEVVNNDEKAGEAREIDIAGKLDANDSIGDEIAEENGKDDEADKENIEVISEPIEPSNNPAALTDAEIPREETELLSEDSVSPQLTKSEEALQETPSESTTLSEMEKENKEYMEVVDSERDNMEVVDSHEPNKLPDKADIEANTSEDQIKDDEKVNTNKPEEVEQNFEVEEKTEENLLDNIEQENAPSIQNEEDPSEKDDNIKNETTEESLSPIDDDEVVSESLGLGTESDVHAESITSSMSQEDSTGKSVAEPNSDEEDEMIKEQCNQDEPEISEAEGSTEVTEAPEEEVQNSISERSFEQDQSLPEKAAEQDGLKIASTIEIETEKPEIGETSSHVEEEASAILQNDDELELEAKPEEKTVAETLTNEEITQRLEEVEEPCITHDKEEIPEAESKTEHKETLNDSSIDTIQQDQQSQESEAKPTDANQATDDILVLEGSEANTTFISSIEEVDERAFTKEDGATTQEENIVVETPKEEAEVAEKIEESTENQIEEIPEITIPSEGCEVEHSQNETVASEIEILEVASDEKFDDENKSTDIDVKSAELESTTEESTEQNEISIEPGNTRELQIDQTEIIAEQDQPSQESDAKPAVLDQATDEVSAVENSEDNATSSLSVEQVGEGSIAKEESVILQEEDDVVEMPKEEAANKKHTEEEITEAETTIEHKETSIEPSISIIQRSEESDTKPTEANDATDISVLEGSEANTTLISSIEQIDERSITKEDGATTQEENIVVEAPKEEAEVVEKVEESTEKQIEEIPETTVPSKVNEVEHSQSETVAPETEILEVASDEKFDDEGKSTDIDTKPAELESTTEESTEQNEISIEPGNTRELQIDQTEIIAEQDQPSQESDAKPAVLDQATDEVSTVENIEDNAASSSSVEQIGEGSVAKEKSVNLQKEDDVVEMPKEEAPNEKHKEEELTEVESTTEHKETSTEPSISIIQQDQQSEESETKPTEANQATYDISVLGGSEACTALISSIEPVDERSITKEDKATTQEENIVVEAPKEEAEVAENVEESTEKQLEEIPEITIPSEVNEVEHNQSETVAPETEILEVASDKKFDDESKSIDIDAKSAELEYTTEQKEISIEPNNTSEVQTSQTEILAGQDQPSQESDVKPIIPDRATDKVSAVENSDVNATLSASVEEIAEGSVAKEESVILEEEEAEEIEAANEKHTEEEITHIAHPCEITQEQLVQTEIVGPEAHHSEIASDEKFGDESKLTETDFKSDQMENSPEELIEEKPNADLSSSAEQINEKSEDSVVLPQSTGELIQGEKIDTEMPKEETNQGTEAAEESCDKHIEGEIRRTADPEINEATEEESKTVLTEKEVNPQIFETQTESPEQEKATEESASVDEKSDATATLVPGEGQIEETEITNKESDKPQSTTESVTVAEAKISQGVEANEEQSNKDIAREIPQIVHPSEITDEQLVEGEIVNPEAEHLEIDLQSDQMENTLGDLIEESSNTNLSSSVGQIIERSEESEVLPQSAGEQVQAEKIDAEMTKEEIVQGVEVPEEPCDKHIEGEIRRAADPEICDSAEEESKAVLTATEVDPQKLETQTKLSEQEKEIQESTSVEEKSDAAATSVSGEGQVEEIEIANNESGVLAQSTTESVIVPEEKISEEVEINEEPSDKYIAGEISQIVHPSEITEVQLVESETLCHETEHMQIVSDEKLEDESELTETTVKLVQMESTSDELIEEKSNASLSSSVEQVSEKFEGSEVILQSTGEQVQGEETDAEMPKEESGQGIEAAEEPCDKHIEGEIRGTLDPEICHAAEESKVLLSEKEVDPQKFGTETESPEQEKTTEESASVEEKSDATAILVPDEGQIEVEILNRESDVVPQSTTESVTVPEEKVSREVETSKEPTDKDIVGEISKIADPEIHDVVVQSKNMSNEEEIDSEKLKTEIESPDLEKATEESALVEEKSDDVANLVPVEGQIEEIEIGNKKSIVAPESIIESVTGPEEKVSQAIETNEEPSDKHIVGELHENDTSIDNFKASEEIHLVQEDKVEEAQTTASPVEQPDSTTGGTEMESALLEKTNDDIDVNANVDESSVTSFAKEEGAVINQTDNGSETLPVVEQTHAEKTKLIDEMIPSDVPAETEELQVQEEALDTVVAEPENSTKDENLIRTETQEGISEIEKVEQEKDIPNIEFEAVLGEFNTDTNQNVADQEAKGQTEREIDATELLKTAEHKGPVDETNEGTEETVPNFSEQNKDIEEEGNQSGGPEQDFASIVSSFLITKVLSEENQKTDDSTKQNSDASFIPKVLDDETIQEITTTKKEPETTDEEISYATSSREVKPEIQEQEEENGGKKVQEDGEEDGVEQDYLPVSRFLMDKILWQEENKNLGEEKAIEATDKHMVSDGGIQVEEKIEESSNLVGPEQKGEEPSSFAEIARDFEKAETLTGKVDNTSVGDGAISTEEEIEKSAVGELPKQEEGSQSPIEVARDFEKEEKPADDAWNPIGDKNKTLFGDVGLLSVEKNEGENSSVVAVAEQEGEKNTTPVEATRDFEKEDKSIEQKKEGLVTNEGISIIEKIRENTGEMAIPKQGEKTLYPVEVVKDFHKGEKPAEQKDETLVSVDRVFILERTEGENTKVTLHEQDVETESSLTEEVEDLACREHSKDLVEEALVNAHETSNPEKMIEENKTVDMHQEEEHKNEVLVDEEIPKDVKNVEENYVFVEHEANQFKEEPKEILKEKVADEVSGVTISNLEEKQTNLSAETHNDKRSVVEQVEITERGMKNSSVSFQEIEQSRPDIPIVPTVTEIVKEPVGNEKDFIHGEEQVKEVTGTVVEIIEKRSQEKHAEIEATEMEKKSEEIKDEEHEEEEEEEEEERRQERETETVGRDLIVKAEARETEMKPAQKKSHNILSGVGSKVKHSFTKVKKAFTGKSKNASPSTK